MDAVLDDHSLIQDVNAIAAHHGSGMMADRHDRMLGFQRTQGVDHDLLVFGVQIAGGFVEHKGRRFGEERPRQSDPLARPPESSYLSRAMLFGTDLAVLL